MAPLGRDLAIKYVKEGKLPLWFGSPHPMVMIVEQDGSFRIRELVVDEAEAAAAREASLASGRCWMPEQYYGHGKPTGKIYAQAKTRDELVVVMTKMKWPKDW